jgi:lipoate-protein ligase A
VSERPWRLIVDPALPGARNMAVDQAIQASREAGECPPTVRFYRWARPTVSLGRFQDVADVDLDACEEFGIDVVRRATGGGAVLHDSELTYSIVASVSDGVPRGVRASYSMFSEALLATYRLLGVDAEIVARTRGDDRTAACYLLHTPADLVVAGRKLSGSAQVWSRDTVLQHGSIVIAADRRAEARVMRLSPAQAERLEAESTALADVLVTSPSVTEVTEAAIRGFAEGLDINLEPASLSAAEASAADALERAATTL